jgi:hypothetical protein
MIPKEHTWPGGQTPPPFGHRFGGDVSQLEVGGTHAHPVVTPPFSKSTILKP